VTWGFFIRGQKFSPASVKMPGWAQAGACGVEVHKVDAFHPYASGSEEVTDTLLPKVNMSLIINDLQGFAIIEQSKISGLNSPVYPNEHAPLLEV
jgi:hypothetical protein